MINFDFQRELTIVIAGEAGQGIDLITHFIAQTAQKIGFNIFYSKEYMSRIKGGCNSSSIRISSEKVCACRESADFVFLLSSNAIEHLTAKPFEKVINSNTIVIYENGDPELLNKFDNKINIAFSSISKEVGGNIYENVIVAGIMLGILNCDSEILKEAIKKIFSDKDDAVIEKNIEVVTKSYEIGKNLQAEKAISIGIGKNNLQEGEILITGNDAAALGCIAGGVDFISAYPMSPSTGILTFMAKHSKEFNIIVEQAEDEISAINMSIGAWYAGARGMVSTSGGGFALMTEGVSLAGMIESPIVIYLGQRPGPATGLPTRTEQGDLNLALYSGHGEFPKIILAPGDLGDCFNLAQKAFNLADKFQVPVFFLTDQYLVDSCYNIKLFELNEKQIEEHIEKTPVEYKRYLLTENGISPRGIPGFGEGLVVVDSDEHDEEGHITEDLDLRTKMVNKRMKKLELIKNEAIIPYFYGEANATKMVVSWGSTSNVIKEALREINNPDIAFLHFIQVYPISQRVLDYFKNINKIICIENNFAGQFANLLKLELNISVDEKILKYNGLPFSIEELTTRISEAAK